MKKFIAGLSVIIISISCSAGMAKSFDKYTLGEFCDNTLYKTLCTEKQFTNWMDKLGVPEVYTSSVEGCFLHCSASCNNIDDTMRPLSLKHFGKLISKGK